MGIHSTVVGNCLPDGLAVWVCCRSLAGTAASNLGGRMDVCLLRVLCAVKWSSLRRADLSSRGILASVMCLSAIMKPHRGGIDPLGLSSHGKKEGSKFSNS